MEKVESKIKEIKLFLFDFDGVLIGEDENLTSEDVKNFERRFRHFAKVLAGYDLYVGIISGRYTVDALEVLRDLPNAFVRFSSLDKTVVADEIISKLKLSYNNVLYAGNGLLDVPLLQRVGLSMAPNNARREVKRAVEVVYDPELDGGVLNQLKKIIKNEYEQN